MTVARHPSPTKGRTMRRSDVRSAAVQPVLHDHDGRFFERPGSLRRDHDLGATLGEAQRAFAADPTRRADDDYDQWLPFAITLGGCYPESGVSAVCSSACLRQRPLPRDGSPAGCPGDPRAGSSPGFGRS